MTYLNEQDRDTLVRIAQTSIVETTRLWNEVSLDESYIDPLLEAQNGSIHPASDLLDSERRILILGDFGAGKTTLLQHRAQQLARKYSGGEHGSKCPILIAARLVQGPFSYNAMCSLINERYQVEIQPEQFISILDSGAVELLVDGLDERPTDSGEFTQDLVTLFRRAPRLDGTITTRPSGLSSNLFGFKNYTLRPFDSERITRFVTQSFREDAKKAAAVRRLITQTYDLEDLAQRPLLLKMIIDVAKHFDKFPENPAAVFELFIDQTLRREFDKSIRRHALNTSQRLALLGRLATSGYENGMNYFTAEDVVQNAKELLGDAFPDPHAILMDLQTTSFLSREGQKGEFSFVHKSYVEYFTAWNFRADAFGLIALLQRKPSREISYFAVGLLEDVRPLAEYAIAAGRLDLAARCVYLARTSNAALTEFVISQFKRAVGKPFLSILLQNTATPNAVQRHEIAHAPIPQVDGEKDAAAPRAERVEEVDKAEGSGAEATTEKPIELLDKFQKLLRDLDQINDSTLPNHTRGSAFERFTSDFFSHVFKVVEQNYRTENGEIDLIVDIADTGPWWLEYGGDALVECKNLSHPVPLSAVATFLNKVSQARVRLGFIVSMSGFTADAERTMKNRSGNVSAPLVVPLDGDRIRAVLQHGEKLEEFFREAVRDIKYVKY